MAVTALFGDNTQHMLGLDSFNLRVNVALFLDSLFFIWFSGGLLKAGSMLSYPEALKDAQEQYRTMFE